MLITFKTNSHAGITMFGDIALQMVKMMGHTPNVPGAILAADVPVALDRLTAAILVESDELKTDEAAVATNDLDDQPISLPHRAAPLIELLSAAAASGDNVMWDQASISG